MSSPQQRLTSIANQVAGGAGSRQQLLAKNPDDVVCISIVQETDSRILQFQDYNGGFN